MGLSQLLSPDDLPWLVLLVLGVIALLRVPPHLIPEVLQRLLPWRRK